MTVLRAETALKEEPRRTRLIPRSLFSRLVLIFIVTLIVVLFVIFISFRAVVASNIQRGFGPYLSHYNELIRQQMEGTPDLKKIASVVEGLPLDVRIEGPGVEWATDPNVPKLSQLSLSRMGDRDTYGAELNGKFYIVVRNLPYATILARRYDPDDERNEYILLGTILAILLVLFASYKSVQWLIRPIALVKDGAERIGRGELDHRIPRDREDELGELSQSINTMAEDIEKMLEAKRQLLLSISHELRSPITRSKVSLQFIEDEKVRENIDHDISAMEELINELLESERLSERHSVLNSSLVSINELVDEAILDHFEDQQERLEVSLLATDEQIMLDPVRIKLLIRNLVANGLRYTRDPYKRVWISLVRRTETIDLVVQDEGEGIAAEHLARVVEPFYRVDPSRQRQTGGYGLGLYLCQLIVQAHRGTMEIQSEVGVGTVITVSLPRASE